MKYGFIKAAAATPEIRVADTKHNAEAVIGMMKKAAEAGADVLVFPELCLSGYTCGDLFSQTILVEACDRALAEVARASADMDMLVFVGLPVRKGGRLYNCAAAVYEGQVLAVIPKTNIPNYGEFYEKRNFMPAEDYIDEITAGGDSVPFGTDILLKRTGFEDFSVACEVCEDLWVPNPPSIRHAMNGASVIVNLSASNDVVSKDEYRRSLVSGQSARLVCGYVYACAGDGESTQDLVFTGHNMICENGQVLSEDCCGSGIIFTEIDIKKLTFERTRMGVFNGTEGYLSVIYGGGEKSTKLTRYISKTPFIPEDENIRAKRCEKILTLQSLGLKKRVEHTNAGRLVVGVSGGLDSTLAMLVSARTLKMLGRPAEDLIAVTMPCFGTTARTKSNAEKLAERLGAELRTVNITASVKQHFEDIGHDIENTDVVFENSQARERTQVLMDIANSCGGLVVGTGDLSELSLGWATYNGDHMSMYGVNGSVPKTPIRYVVGYCAEVCGDSGLSGVLKSILDTPVSPELLPAVDGEISQKTEDLVGPYELHDFFLYYLIRWGYEPSKVYYLAKYAFGEDYDGETILKWLKTFCRRFFNQQFKRSCIPDGPKVGSVSLSPRGDWRMPSDGCSRLWLEDLENI